MGLLTMANLRDYQPGDEEAVFHIVKEVLGEYGLETNPEETDADLADIEASYLDPGGVFRILEFDGKTVGSYGLYAVSPKSCELRKMYLLGRCRGQGLGRMMMDDAFITARELGFTEMILETNSRLKEALAMYRKFGFEEFCPEHLSDRCDLALRKAL